ncbi:MAG: hypothetical protein K9M08_17975 [Pirellula sp.]|nr:hypothetical protein [Pirellula sp.]
MQQPWISIRQLLAVLAAHTAAATYFNWEGISTITTTVDEYYRSGKRVVFIRSYQNSVKI